MHRNGFFLEFDYGRCDLPSFKIWPNQVSAFEATQIYEQNKTNKIKLFKNNCSKFFLNLNSYVGIQF